MRYFDGYRYSGKTEYKYVYLWQHSLPDKPDLYMARLPRVGKTKPNNKPFFDIREAAKCVDMWLIRHGKEPINILKRT